MRRKDREITSISDIMGILEQCKVGHFAMSEGDTPYVVPMNFAACLENGTITVFAHCAKEGKRLSILRGNPKVCFEADCEHQLILSDIPCQNGFRYASVIGQGAVREVLDPEEKARALACLLKWQTGKEFSVSKEQTDTVCVLALPLDQVTGKRR